MNIYMISQNVNNEPHTFDSAVVIAHDENGARLTHPSTIADDYEKNDYDWGGTRQINGFVYSGTWCDPKDVIVKLIGKAESNQRLGVIIANFNE